MNTYHFLSRLMLLLLLAGQVPVPAARSLLNERNPLSFVRMNSATKPFAPLSLLEVNGERARGKRKGGKRKKQIKNNKKRAEDATKKAEATAKKAEEVQKKAETIQKKAEESQKFHFG